MKQFIAFIRKEFLHLLRDRRTLFIIIAIPIIQLTLFGFAITTEVKNINVAVFDPSKDNVSQQIIKKIDASEYFNLHTILDSPEEINTVFEQNSDMNLIIVFSEEFESNFLVTGNASIQLIADASDPNQASTYTGYASAIINDYLQETIADKGVNIKPIQIKAETRMLYNPHIKSSYNFVPGVMGMVLILICAMMTSISIVREKENGTMEILLSSPVRPINVIISKIIPYFALSLFNFIVILLISVYVLGVPVAGNIFTLFGVSLLFIVVALGIGMLVSNIVDTQVAAMLICGMGFILPVILLSGMIFPIESMPVILQWFSKIIPATWYISAVRKVMIMGLGISSILKELAVLGTMAIVLLGASLKTFNERLG